MKNKSLYLIANTILIAAVFLSAPLSVSYAKSKKKDRKPVDLYVQHGGWAKTMHACAEKARTTKHIDSDIDFLLSKLYRRYPNETGWFIRDASGTSNHYFTDKDHVQFEFGLIISVINDL